jgi:hypothetical protein
MNRNLERVKKLAEKLSPEHRADLFEQLAELPDSPVKLLPRPLPPPTLDEKNALKEINLRYEIRREKGEIVYSFEGREIFRLQFNADNYVDVLFEKFKTKEPFLRVSEKQRTRIYAAVKDILRQEGMSVTDKQLRRIEKQALLQFCLENLKASLVQAAKHMDENLPQVVALIFPKVSQANLLGGANRLREMLHLSNQRIPESDIRKALQGSEWDYLKRIVGITAPKRGGPRNIKHVWTNAELDCLARTYESLKPVWIEAKQIARAAQRSRISSRSKNWRDEVLRAFPDLPVQLVDRFEHLRADDAKPSDIAIVHAKIKCGVGETYSARQLRAKIRKRNLKAKADSSRTSPQTRKVKPKKMNLRKLR